MLVAMFWIVVFVGAGWLGSFGPPWTREWVLGFVCMASLALLAAVETWRGKR